MSKVTVNGQEYDSIHNAMAALTAMRIREDKENAERLPEFHMMTVNYLSCSWCNQIIADHVLESDRQQTEYEHIRKVHPLAEKFFFHVA